jgi:hypothetical protein
MTHWDCNDALTFCCASRLDDDTPRTEMARATRGRVDTDAGVRRALRETRARRPQRERDILNKDRKSTQNTQGPVARIGRLFFIKARSRNGDWDSGGGSWLLLRCPRKAGNRHYSQTGSPPAACFFFFFALSPSFLLHTTKSKMKRWRSVCVSTRR